MIDISFSVDLDPYGTVITHLAERWVTNDQIAELAARFKFYDIEPTWFVRADFFIRNRTGSVLDEMQSFLDAHGDSFWGWHPHLERGRDEAQQLVEIFDSIRSAGIYPSVIRVGEGRGSNDITSFVATSGIKIDCSAIPGRFRDDDQRTFDWRGCPNDLFWQNRNNYRFPQHPLNGEVVQVPMTTALLKASFDIEPKLRYLDLCFRHDVFSTGFVDAVNQGIKHIHVISHPETLLEAGFENGLYKSGWDNVRENLNFINDFNNFFLQGEIRLSNIQRVSREFICRTVQF